MPKEKQTFRIFIGTYLQDKSSFQDYNTVQAKFESAFQLQIKWVSLENLHMTWKFLGNITSKRIERTVNEINLIKHNFKPMELRFDIIEIWPKPSSPRQIVWRGYDLNSNIKNNFKMFDKSLKIAGFAPERRPFNPHITLGRFKIKDKPDQPIVLSEELYIKPVQFQVNKLSIIKSELLSSGPIYTVIEEIEL